ncbi:MAG: M20/M25/M40 family metallo-hydrolase [Chitinophagaceae bacterium]
MRGLSLCLICLFTYSFIHAQSDDSLMIRKIADEVLVNGKAYDNLHELTKNIGQRLSGSQGMVKAEKWGIEKMKQSGADKSWLQQCMVPHWVRGAAEELRITSGADKNKKLAVAALGNSTGTGIKGVNGQVIEIKTFEELETKKNEIKGKIVFYNYPFNPKLIRTFESYADAVRYRYMGPTMAAKNGAVAVLVRSMSHSVDNNPHTGATASGDSIPKIPSMAVGLKDADWLDQQLQKGSVSVFYKSNSHFLPDTIGHSVIGELTGTESPNEFITVGGHLDSWDLAEGAHDDGAGMVQTIEILRALKAIGYKPKHTIRFVLFANEENGLRGGSKYAEEAKAKNEKHIFALESDAGGFTPRGISFGGTAEQLKKVQAWIPLLQPYGVYEIEKGEGGADVGPIAETMGIPAGELIPDSQRYFDYHHAKNDVLENVNKRELELGALNMAAFIYLVDKYGL